MTPPFLDFRLLFNSAPGLFLVLTPELQIVAASDAYLRATMTAREAIVGKSLFDVFPDTPGDPDATGVRNLRASLERVVSSRAPDAMAVQKYPIRRPDSEGGGFEERHWSPSNFPVLAADDHVAYIIHRVEDVTEFLRVKQEGIDRQRLSLDLRADNDRMEREVFERAQEIQDANRRLREANDELNSLRARLELDVREREEALRSSDEHFHLLVEGVKDYAMFLLDRKGHVLSWNPGAERIMGYAEADIVGQSHQCFYSPGEVAGSVPERDLRQAAEKGSLAQAGWRTRKNGSRFWASGVLTALYDAEHQVRGYAEISRDLTAQREAEVVLQSIVDTAIDGIITIDHHGTMRTFNRAAEEIFGYAASEAIGRNVKMLMPDPYHGEHDGYLEAFVQTREAKVIGIGREVIGLRKDGSTFPLELAVSEFRQEGELCFTGLLRDISVRKKLETQLHQAQKMEAIGQLAGGVAHDFNNLLSVICGYTEVMLEMPQADEELRPMVEEVHRAGQRATSLTRQLLAFSRQQVLAPRVLDLNAVIGDAEKMLRRLIGEDIQMTTILTPGLSRVKADPGQIEQVIMNLAVNARDAMPEGGKLTIETHNTELDSEYVATRPHVRPGKYVALVITDTGCGMPPDVRDRIFEPFFTTKGVGRGTGLGLSVVHGIVEQSAGHVRVYSEPGLGTAFEVCLPAIEEPQESVSAKAASVVPRGTETVLLCEDDTALRDLAARALTRFGYTVLKASGGDEALRILETRAPDISLLLTDVVMPEMSGRKLAELVVARHPTIRVLYMSGYTDDAIVRHGILQADIAFLQKPFTVNALGSKVRAVLDQA